MTKKLIPYGSENRADNIAKVGKSKTPAGLAARLASADLVAKAGSGMGFRGDTVRRVVRRNSAS